MHRLNPFVQQECTKLLKVGRWCRRWCRPTDCLFPSTHNCSWKAFFISIKKAKLFLGIQILGDRALWACLTSSFVTLILSVQTKGSIFLGVIFWWLRFYRHSQKSKLEGPTLALRHPESVFSESWLAMLQGFSPINPWGCVNRVAFSFWRKWQDGITGSIRRRIKCIFRKCIFWKFIFWKCI